MPQETEMIAEGGTSHGQIIKAFSCLKFINCLAIVYVMLGSCLSRFPRG